ncbi:MAG: DNA-binding response regulator, partial [Planctomycetes bacterium RBG_13_63_9]
MSIRLLVCDDHQVIRTGLASLLAGTEIEIVAEAANGQEAIKQALKVKPDVILLDIRMPDGDGLSTLEQLRVEVPESKVVMLSTYDNPTYIARAVALGACDYVLKGSSREAIVATITAAGRGESPSRSGELRRIAGAMKVRQAIDDDDVPLTQRETQVLRHVALGLSNKEIGRSLEISVET